MEIFSHRVRLWLSVIAYNLGNLWRLVLPKRMWRLCHLQKTITEAGGCPAATVFSKIF
jgi:hypothetical protein